MNKIIRSTLAFFMMTLSTTIVFSQEAVKARPSPLAIVTMKYEDSYIKVTYSQPHKRDRKIFGTLVKYGEVWRTGANEATEITLTDNVVIKNDTLMAGTYSIFTIPNEKEWTVIFNKQLGQWGSYNYHEPSDVMRLSVPTEKITEVIFEPFTITFEQKNEEAHMVMMWDDTKVAIPIHFID